MQQLVRRDPRTSGQATSRWSLPAIRQACPWLTACSLAGVQQILARLRVSWQRARSYVLSPDPDYALKHLAITIVCDAVQAAPTDLRVLFLDEVTIERQPTVASEYAPIAEQPRACRSHHSNTTTRVVATLDGLTGRVCFRRAGAITIPTLVQFYRDLCAAYPTHETLYVVQDNWPLHWHPDVLVALEPQRTPFRAYRPGSWSSTPSAAAQRKWGQLRLPIQIVPLPTYASWLNPIEKLWRKLRQEVTHLHRRADDLPGLREDVDRFLMQFAAGSDDLLRYVGLCTGTII